MASTAVSNHSGAGPLSLMSCVRESSPQESIPDIDNDKTIASKKKFWNPRKWFKRKTSKASEDSIPTIDNSDTVTSETLRSRSTSEISETDDAQKRRSGTPMHPGLSVSHDSIFHSPNSGSELELDEAQSSSSLSIHQPTQTDLRLQTELSERLRLRRGRGDTSEDDEGLPRSPCCSSPTATEGLLEKTVKNHPTKSHSTCSDGSLLSMCSSDIEDDSFGQQSSRNSSKISLSEKKVADQDSEWELGPSHASAPLNHSAAHHRVSVRPKRTHGAPRRNRIPPIMGSALPTTPEVNEEASLRSVTPELSKETVTELYSSSMSKNRTEIQLKCSSLPPGLAPPGNESNKLSRSRSSASSKSQDTFAILGEEEEDKDDKKSDNSIFSRLFPRRSAKKKKAKSDNVLTSYNKQVITEAVPEKLKSGPASRQRVQPIDIPPSPDQTHRDLEKSGTSPLQLELENHLRQRMTLSLSTSPLPSVDTPPKSPKVQELRVHQNVWSGETRVTTTQVETLEISSKTSVEEKSKIKVVEESKSKMKIAGLSSLQQRVLQLNDEENFKSLTDFSHSEAKSSRQITKSQSFRTTLNESNVTESATDKVTVVKTNSADNVKHVEIVKAESSESLESVSSAQTNSTEYLDSLNLSNGITISGPSHTSVVSVSKAEDKVKAQPILVKTEEVVSEEQQVSITKIHVKRETVQSAKESTPEFLNVHLNKVEQQPASNVVLVANLSKAEVEKPVFNFDKPQIEHHNSQDDIDLPYKSVSTPSTPNVIITSMTPPPISRMLKKPPDAAQVRKTSLVTTDAKPKLSLRTKSNSLDIVDSLKQDDCGLINLDKPRVLSTTDLSDATVVRRKSLIKQKQDEEPELMKVFARRSLKVKDGEELAQQVLTMIEDEKANKSKECDKENRVDCAPEKKSVNKEPEKLKEPLTESKYVETTEVTLRKPAVNNKMFAYQQRTISLNIPKVNEINNTEKVHKKSLFSDRPKTEIAEKLLNKAWITTVRKDKDVDNNDEVIKKISRDSIITEITSKSDFINEDFPAIPKNFNQRKAEWEKRAQEALKKNVP
ncbi:uncharacterized protein LOC116168089 isoform X1 [Photinus pyralis]|uniref:DUF4592 domain-containing protein n=3 Tax=Photinus pyralis TaxID=7054 RepID=A0A1Y1N472_PHOPY|nr:uncharacterized protein LOC116168089 isoform X1 [Photinus pyralis]